jgi:hypothetical protein
MLPAIRMTNPTTLYLRSPLASVLTEDHKTLPLHFHIIPEEEAFETIMSTCRGEMKLVFDLSFNAMGTKTMPNESLLVKTFPEGKIDQKLKEIPLHHQNQLTKNHFITKSTSFFGIKTSNHLSVNSPRFLNLSDEHVEATVHSMFAFLEESGVEYINFVVHEFKDEEHGEAHMAKVEEIKASMKFEIMPEPHTQYNYQMLDEETLHIRVPKVVPDDIEEIDLECDGFAFDQTTSKVLALMLEENVVIEYQNIPKGFYIFASDDKLLVINNSSKHYKLHNHWGQLSTLRRRDIKKRNEMGTEIVKVNRINRHGYFNYQIVFDGHTVTDLILCPSSP